MTTSTNGNGNLVDEFEEAFQHCLNLLTKEDGLENSSNNTPPGNSDSRLQAAEVSNRFIDLARQVEAFFIQKRFLLSVLKPELSVKEDIADLKIELLRKEELIKRHYEKISVWQNLLQEMHGWVQPNALAASAQGVQNLGNNTPNSGMVQQLFQNQTMQQQQQQQQQMQLLQQHQLQQQLHQQQIEQGPVNTPPMHMQNPGMPVGQPGMFMNQGNIPSPRPTGFPVGGMANTALQGPLAFLEKTTSNIGMPERRS